MKIERAGRLVLQDVLGRDEMLVAVGADDLRGDVLAAALYADWLAVESGAALLIDTPAAWGGVIWRMGRSALRLFAEEADGGGVRVTAVRATDLGLVDALVPAGRDPLEWVGEWVGTRSPIALDAAANLIRRRGGDITERAEFARLFGAGEPQKGLAAFLEKRMRSDR